MWKKIHVNWVFFREKRIITAEDLKNMQKVFTFMTDEHLKRQQEMGDHPETRSRYHILLKTPLDTDHERSFDFRDEKVVEFRVDG